MIESAALFRFDIRATGIDPEGYYYVNWEKAQRLSVVAHTKDAAQNKALAMLGTHPRFGSWRRPGSGWTFKWDEISEVVAGLQNGPGDGMNMKRPTARPATRPGKLN